MITRRKALELAAFTPALAATGAIASDPETDPVPALYADWLEKLMTVRIEFDAHENWEGPEFERIEAIEMDAVDRLAIAAPSSMMGVYCKLSFQIYCLSVNNDDSFSNWTDKLDQTNFLTIMNFVKEAIEAEGLSVPPCPAPICDGKVGTAFHPFPIVQVDEERLRAAREFKAQREAAERSARGGMESASIDWR